MVRTITTSRIEEEEDCPSGQCIYRALRSIKCELSLTELNSALEKKYTETKKPIGFWGIPSDRWHYSVVSWAFHHKYGSGNYLFKKIDVNDITNYKLTTGRVIIDGIINSREWYPDDEDHTDRAQRHCVGADLERGVFYDFFMDEGRERRSVYKLFAPSKGRTSGRNPYMFSSQSSQRYFRRILKVFVVRVDALPRPPLPVDVNPQQQEIVSPRKNDGPLTRSMKRQIDEDATAPTAGKMMNDQFGRLTTMTILSCQETPPRRRRKVFSYHYIA